MEWTHDDLASDLAAFLRSKSDRLIWTDMQLGPAGSPRPDVYAVPLSFTRFQPLAYECKVSVSDFRADVTKGKWSDYLRFACAVIFAVPEGLVTKADLPEGCGLMTRGPAGWRTVKGPTMRPLDNLPRDAWVKLLIDGMKREAERSKIQQMSVWSENYRLRDKIGHEIADLMGDRLHAQHRYEEATEKLKRAADDALQEREKIIKGARDRAAEESRVVDAARAELAQMLGLPADASAYNIAQAARRAGRALDRDELVGDLQRRLTRIREAVGEIEAPYISKEAA